MKQSQDSPYENDKILFIKIDDKKRLAKILSSESQIFYEVDFGDGTFSNDMLPNDIIVSNYLLRKIL